MHTQSSEETEEDSVKEKNGGKRNRQSQGRRFVEWLLFAASTWSTESLAICKYLINELATHSSLPILFATISHPFMPRKVITKTLSACRTVLAL